MKTLFFVITIIFMILFGFTFFIYLWIHLYEKYFKKIFHEIKMKFIYNALNSKKEIPENTLNKYKDIIDKDSKKKISSPIDISNVEITERIKTIIDEMISIEVYSCLREYITTNKKYPIIKIDEDIKNISSTVFESINIKVYNTNLVFTSEYLMHYIVTQSFNMMLKTTTDFNAKII